MPYPRFNKVIINHFISKGKTISMRNRINLHTVRDDTLLGTLKFVSKTQYYQQYGALIPDEIINQDIKDSKAYKTYLDFATGKATPKKARKFKKVASPLKKLSPVLEEEPVEKPKRAKKPAKKSTTVPTAGVVIRDTPNVSVSKNKAPTKVDRGKGMDLLSEAALLEAAQLKKTLKKSKLEQRVVVLEKELAQLKQVDYSAQLLEAIKSQIPAMVDAQLSTRLKDSIQKTFRSYTAEFKKRDKDERKRYIDLVEKFMKDSIKDEVKSQLPRILPKEVSEFATPMIQSTIIESLENVILAKSSS
ncbi:hypothetical protein Tco_0276308 [Tanacetum coccineum]